MKNYNELLFRHASQFLKTINQNCLIIQISPKRSFYIKETSYKRWCSTTSTKENVKVMELQLNGTIQDWFLEMRKFQPNYRIKDNFICQT